MTKPAAPPLGIFTRTFDRPDLAGVLDAVRASDIGLVHFNFKSAGLETLPAGLTTEACDAVRAQCEARGLMMAGISATFNAIHPDINRRARETSLACDLIACAPLVGTSVVTLCTGTRDPVDMWQWHPENSDPSAWEDLCAVLERLLDAARPANVVLGIEPERNNVVSSARAARRLLDQFGDDHLKIIIDPANLLTPATARRGQAAILRDAFELLHSDVVMVHAKDLADDGDVAAGQGLVDYDLYFRLLATYGLAVPIVMHELREADVPSAKAFVLRHLREHMTIPPNESQR